MKNALKRAMKKANMFQERRKRGKLRIIRLEIFSLCNKNILLETYYRFLF